MGDRCNACGAERIPGPFGLMRVHRWNCPALALMVASWGLEDAPPPMATVHTHRETLEELDRLDQAARSAGVEP